MTAFATGSRPAKQQIRARRAKAQTAIVDPDIAQLQGEVDVLRTMMKSLIQRVAVLEAQNI